MNLGSLRWGQKAIKYIIKAGQEIVILHMYIMYIHIQKGKQVYSHVWNQYSSLKCNKAGN